MPRLAALTKVTFARAAPCEINKTDRKSHARGNLSVVTVGVLLQVRELVESRRDQLFERMRIRPDHRGLRDVPGQRFGTEVAAKGRVGPEPQILFWSGADVRASHHHLYRRIDLLRIRNQVSDDPRFKREVARHADPI